MITWAGDCRKMREALEAATGLPVQCGVLANDTIGVEFIVLPGKLPWRKAFVVDKDRAVPDMFLAMLQSWRQEMLKKLDQREMTGVLRGVLAEFGEPAVKEALHTKLKALH